MKNNRDKPPSAASTCSNTSSGLGVGLCAQLACVWEVTARKPGNVHRHHDFDDVGYLDFLASAAASAPVFEVASQHSVGETILEAVRATRRVSATNTNLGIVLLLAPLATVPSAEELRGGVARVLGRLTHEDARLAYAAIRLAKPGGLGITPTEDIAAEPTRTLREAMALAADRDTIARQYTDGFQAVFARGVPALQRGLERTGSLEGAIVYCHLCLLADFPDSLLARKRGLEEAREASRRAQQVLDCGWPASPRSTAELADLDHWLRACGHARNPGTTADLVAASLFVALRQGTIMVPCPLPWSGDW